MRGDFRFRSIESYILIYKGASTGDDSKASFRVVCV